MRTIERDIVGAFIFSKDGKVLFGKTGAYEGLWVVPGGGIEEDETKLQALIRETLEETGIDIKDAEITPFKEIHHGESEKTLRNTGERVLVKMKFFDYKIAMKEVANKINIDPTDDLSDLHWFSREELAKLEIISPPTIKILHQLGYLKK